MFPNKAVDLVGAAAIDVLDHFQLDGEGTHDSEKIMTSRSLQCSGQTCGAGIGAES